MQRRCEIWNSLKMVGKYGFVRTYLQDSASVIKGEVSGAINDIGLLI